LLKFLRLINMVLGGRVSLYVNLGLILTTLAAGGAAVAYIKTTERRAERLTTELTEAKIRVESLNIIVGKMEADFGKQREILRKFYSTELSLRKSMEELEKKVDEFDKQVGEAEGNVEKLGETLNKWQRFQDECIEIYSGNTVTVKSPDNGLC
jgi:predicted RNase H-like nuclease (RuvC/YqgF family)